MSVERGFATRSTANADKFITPAFYRAYMRGREDFEAGKTVCPYAEKRTEYHNGTTFSAAFMRYWREGWTDARDKAEVRYEKREPRRNKRGSKVAP